MAMNTRKLTLLITALLGFAVSGFAQIQATVAKVTGSATVTLADGSSTAVSAGQKVPQGATIKTSADGEVYLESHAGYITNIKKNSEVVVEEVSVSGGKENTTLGLKSGNLVAMLDAKKKAVNNYQVRTPKGVAAARGTVFSVVVNGERVNVSVVGGTVSFSGGGLDFSIGAGNMVKDGVSSSMSEATGSDATMIAELVAAVGAAVQAGLVPQADFNAVLSNVAAAAPALMPEVTATVKAAAPAVIESAAQSGAGVTVETVREATPATTTPQAIDPSTVSRSN